ncbi:MAG: hypothetical protein MJ246_02985 [Clostridia bacterium]|nr:hypothetical protein [Clostridia bacterium]
MFEINLYEEVYGVIGNKSVRGCIILRTDEEIVVCFESGEIVNYSYADLDEKIFCTEKALIKKCGSQVHEFASPKKKTLSEANDFYNLPVKVGDYVVAIAGNPLYCRVEGKIEKIYKEYSEFVPERVYVDLRKKEDQTFTRVEVCNLCLQSRFAN